MASSNISRDLEREVADLASIAGKEITAAIQSRDVQKKADDATTSSGRTPPRAVVAIFEEAAEAAAKRLKKKYEGTTIEWALSYKMKKESWIATASATAAFELETRGGKSYQLEPGDTLWGVSQEVYGSGIYWENIQKANKAVLSKGNFIISGMGLDLPKLDVLANPEASSVATSARPSTEAEKAAKEVLFPTLEQSFEIKGDAISKGPWGATVIFNWEYKGKFRLQTGGVIGATWNIDKMEAEVKEGTKEWGASMKFDLSGPKEVAVYVTPKGRAATSKLALQKDGSLKGSMQLSKKWNRGDDYFEVVGEVAVSLKIVPDIEENGPRTVPIGERVKKWLMDNDKVLKEVQTGVGVVTLGTLTVITAVIAAPVVGPLVVTYGAAMAAAAPAMKLAFQ